MRISDWSSDVCSSDLPHFDSIEMDLALEHAIAIGDIGQFLRRRLPPERQIAARIAAEAPQCLDMGKFELQRLGLAQRGEQAHGLLRSEERRVGEESGRTCRTLWAPHT